MSDILSSSTKKIVWKIPNIKKQSFSVDALNTEKFSKLFLVINDDHFMEWYLCFEAKNSDCGVYLHLENCSTHDFKIVFSVDLVRANRGKLITRSFHQVGKEFYPPQGWGWKDFVKTSELMQNFDDFVVDETLTLSCMLTVHLLQPSEEKASEPSNKDFFMSYKALFHDKTFSDFKIESNDGKTFKVHKVVLALKSKIFKSMLTWKMKETHAGICKIEDFNSKTIEAMLKHIYFQEISDLDEIASDLIFAAEKYGLDELKDLCLKSILKTLNTENVIEALKLSEKIFESDRLYNKCVAVALKNYNDLCETREWKEMSHALLLKLCNSYVNAQMNIINL